MGEMKSFAMWLANEIYNEKSSELKAWAKAKGIYGFIDDDRPWFHEQYKTVQVDKENEMLVESMELELRDDDPVHSEPTQEELDQEKWNEEHQKEIEDEWMKYYRKH